MHAVEVGQRSSPELPNYRDRSRRVRARCKAADESCYSRRECRLHHPTQTPRRSSAPPTASNQWGCICGSGGNACPNVHSSQLAWSQSLTPSSSDRAAETEIAISSNRHGSSGAASTNYCKVAVIASLAGIVTRLTTEDSAGTGRVGRRFCRQHVRPTPRNETGKLRSVDTSIDRILPPR
jgi:hypothetical protein